MLEICEIIKVGVFGVYEIVEIGVFVIKNVVERGSKRFL